MTLLRRSLLSFLVSLMLVAPGLAADKPNFIVIFTDDQGYADLSCFGSKNIKTPHIDRMAKEGLKLTSFMVASPVCTPSRAALLTGSYPKRVGLHEGVLFPDSTTGLNPKEHTIAKHLKAAGYATGMFGKWHLGHLPETLPTRHGFDEFFGIPYSNDMNHGPDEHEGGKMLWSERKDELWTDQETAVTKWNTPLMEGEKIVELPADQRTISRRFTDRAIDFIRRNKEKPFFVYLPHAMPHVPLYVPEDVYDPNPENAYKNVIEHLDAETGKLLDALREMKLDQNTYVIFTSDNGPWTCLGNHAGSALPLKGYKGRTDEGGMRVPCVIWAPGRIPAKSVSNDLATTLDLLPTIAKLSGAKLPASLKHDGVDLSGFLADPTSKSPRNEFLYYSKKGPVQGLRQGDWKLLRKVKHRKKGEPEHVGPPIYVHSLYNLATDLSEENNLAEEHPERVEAMVKRLLELDAEIAENARPVWGKP